MRNLFHKLHFGLLLITLGLFLGAAGMLLKAYYTNVEYFVFLGVLIYIVAIVLTIITALYPFIYKAELIVEKMEDEEEHKKNK